LTGRVGIDGGVVTLSRLSPGRWLKTLIVVGSLSTTFRSVTLYSLLTQYHTHLLVQAGQAVVFV